MPVQLIADSGATKCQWCLLSNGKKKIILTQGISPYFLTRDQIVTLLQQELMPDLKNADIDTLHFYGTGLTNPANVKIVRIALKELFPNTEIVLNDDLLGAARALCGKKEGIACILGTGSNSCYYDGEKILKNSPALGYVLGDEGSGAYLGKKVIQYYLYGTFDEDLAHRFNKQFGVSKDDILTRVYKQPLANRYLASYAIFLAENRGHYMIENIIEDGLNDFFFNHLYKYAQSWTLPINFTGSIAYGFKDVLQELCDTYELELGNVFKSPMDGLVDFHTQTA
ncbi:N-acetylglucosamine kinase [Parasediminibacterium sp. JCM 36343]|uniref:N-acetylglucosamine kinase n=1 Tax=Parasediminibacterium sp. JCM 36343 TaxID=3374279 RepID=UPI003979208B